MRTFMLNPEIIKFVYQDGLVLLFYDMLYGPINLNSPMRYLEAYNIQIVSFKFLLILKDNIFELIINYIVKKFAF